MQTHSIQFGHHAGAHSNPSGSAMHTLMHMKKVSNQLAHAKEFAGRFVTSHPRSSGNKQHDELVKQTEKWVSQTFFGEMLKQMRNSPFKSKMMDGGDGGQAFTQMFDQQMADKMAHGTGKKLVDSIVNKIEAGKAYAANAPAKSKLPRKTAHLDPHLISQGGGIK